MINKYTKIWFIAFLCFASFSSTKVKCAELQLDQAAGPFQLDYSPADGSQVATNPPPFIWAPPRHGLTYILELASTEDFSNPALHVKDIRFSTHALSEPLDAGLWHWRYGVQSEDGAIQYSKTRSFTVPADCDPFPFPNPERLIASIPEARPRLFILQNELNEYRRRAREGDLRVILQSLLKSGDSSLGEELVPEPPYVQGEGAERGENYLKIFTSTRPPMDAMERCALAYLLSGEKKYGEEAKRRLLHFFRWDPEGSTSYSNNDEPAMWVMMRGVRAYDWTHDLFTKEERETIEPVMRIRAAQMYDHLLNQRKFHTNPYESHAGRTLGFLGEAALAFAPDWPEASEWLNYVLTMYWNVYPAWGREDGGWHEGPSYWSYYMSFALHFVVPLRTVAGVDLMQKPFFQNTPYYKLYTNPPYARISPFGDGEHNGPGRGMGQLLYQFSTLLQDPYLRWYADVMKVGPENSVLGVVLQDDALSSKSPSDLPSSRYFPGVGLVSLHTDLGKKEDDIHFLIHSDPYGSISHAHADQNAFTLEAYGEALAIASGFYPWYGSKHHANWQWESKSSNTITVDGGLGQKKRDPASKGKITAFESKGEFEYVEADASSAYPDRLTKFVRKVVHLQPGIFVLYDEVEAPRPVAFEWRLHTLSEMKLQPDTNSIVAEQGNAALQVHFCAPEAVQFEQSKGFPDPPEHGEPDQYHLVVTPKDKSKAEKFLTVLIPYKKDSSDPMPEITSIQGDNLIGVQIKTEKSTRLVCFKTDSASDKMSSDRIESDASVVAVSIQNGQIQNKFLHQGSSVAWKE